MYKFLFKLTLLVIGIYLLIQIPFFGRVANDIKNSFSEKVQNVTTEADRIKGKINGIGEKIDETKKTVTGIADKVAETKKSVEDTFTTLNKTADALKEAVKTDPVIPDSANNYSDLTPCGNFPASSGDGGPTSRYFVCRSAKDGQCYYKKTYFEQIQGCDPQFDKYPYGKEECFTNKSSLFTSAGKPLQSVAANSNDKCAVTTPDYFKSKVTE